MKELFDEVAGQSRLDPQEVARQASAPPKRKRFYKDVGVAEGEGGFTVTLDGKPIRTPSQAIVVVPARVLAETMAAEWDAQQEFIDPLSMPLTRLANSVVQGVAGREQLVADDIAKFFGSDLLFYRAEFPDELIANQGAHWDPVLRWAADNLGAHFILAQGIMPVQQPEQAIAHARTQLPSDAWRIGALHVVTTITGSALLALALQASVRDADAVWAAAHVDEDWNIARWGADEEVAARRAVRRRDFDAAVKVIEALRG
ncbi:MAG: ATPase [Proteobacteria bacterium SG_bin9]|nr:MAG: ATPase [Proteobacteria bacterium SG_bin9]